MAIRQGEHVKIAVVIAVTFLSACSTRVAREQIQSPGQALFNGYANPKADCHRCHGGAAQGGLTGPNLKVVAGYTDEEIIEEIDDGPSIMPAYRDLLTKEEKQQIVDWLRLKFPPREG